MVQKHTLRKEDYNNFLEKPTSGVILFPITLDENQLKDFIYRNIKPENMNLFLKAIKKKRKELRKFKNVLKMYILALMFSNPNKKHKRREIQDFIGSFCGDRPSREAITKQLSYLIKNRIVRYDSGEYAYYISTGDSFNVDYIDMVENYIRPHTSEQLNMIWYIFKEHYISAWVDIKRSINYSENFEAIVSKADKNQIRFEIDKNIKDFWVGYSGILKILYKLESEITKDNNFKIKIDNISFFLEINAPIGKIESSLNYKFIRFCQSVYRLQKILELKSLTKTNRITIETTLYKSEHPLTLYMISCEADNEHKLKIGREFINIFSIYGYTEKKFKDAINTYNDRYVKSHLEL